jgi:hypothetical protein
MLLSIDKEKINELLANTPQFYTVTSSHMESAQIKTEPPSISVYGTTSNLPFDVTSGRKRLLSLRSKIIESGTKLLDAEALRREIDEIKGRQ